MLRRLLLVGVFVVINPGSVEQLAYATLVSVLYLAIQSIASPFKDVYDDFMAAACSLALVVLFILCGLYKFAALTDLDDVQRVMSLELKLDYLTSYVSLSTILMLACLSAFLVLGSIVTVLAFEDERRRRHDARVALARRLRYKDGGEEVDLGALRKNAGFSTQKLQKNDEFQLFLRWHGVLGISDGARAHRANHRACGLVHNIPRPPSYATQPQLEAWTI